MLVNLLTWTSQVCLSVFSCAVSVKWLAVKTASEMTYIDVSDGALNSTPTNLLCVNENNNGLNPLSTQILERRTSGEDSRTSWYSYCPVRRPAGTEWQMPAN